MLYDVENNKKVKMKIQSVQSNQAFTGSQYFLSTDAHQNLVNVLVKLNNGTKFTLKGNTFASRFKRRERGCVIWWKILLCTCFYEKKLKGIVSWLLEKNVRILINNQTGEIEKCIKPFFMRWKKVLKHAENIIKTLNDEYNNSEKVKKHVISVAGLLRDILGNVAKF